VLAELRTALTPLHRGELRARYNLAERWLLSFAGSTARKNAEGVLAGFGALPPEKRTGVQVVLVGCEPAAYRTHLLAEAARLGIAQQCRIHGFVPHEDLPALLRGACGLLMPSRYEGFGLPVLDAFACGVPVLTSLVSAMPEVAGDAAVYCDPDDAASIGAGIARLIEPATARELVRRGRLRLTSFSWDHTARAMCAVYEMSAAEARPQTLRAGGAR
jgi:glycosyltransferase involved in cell wall biosynthesis